jgi:HEAT repeat protein
VAGLDDEHPDVRSAAAQALWAFWSGHDPESGAQIQPGGYTYNPYVPRTTLPRQDEAIAKLTAMLADNRTQVRRSAAQALGAFGVDAQSAQSALRKLAQDSDATVAKAAAEAVDNIEAGVSYSGLIRPLAPPEGHALPSSDANH